MLLSTGGDRDAKTLFVKNLSYDTDKDSLGGFFSDAVDIRMPLKEDGSGYHRGYVKGPSLSV